MTGVAPGHAAVERPRIGIVGYGDVAQRHYLTAMEPLGQSVEVLGCSDTNPEAAERGAARARNTWPQARAFSDPVTMIRDAALDAVFNLTPAPLHGAITEACLEAGASVYSEKPIASTLAQADRVIQLATERGLLLLCAPAEVLLKRSRWLRAIVDSGKLGPLTLAVAHHADTGPATWREYTGDPSVFYATVGPVHDHGVYRLHLMTWLLGPVKRVQAMGSISAPDRPVWAPGPKFGQRVPVTTPDHVMMNLEFANGSLGQLLASFAAPGTQAPWLELHFQRGSMSMTGPSWVKDGQASLFLEDDSPLGLEGWIHGLKPLPPFEPSVVELGARHFVACLRDETEPVLTAEHARHVLDIIVKAYDSIADGRSHETETTP